MIFFSERVSGYLFLAHGIILLFTFGVARCSNTPEEEQRSAELSSSTVPLKQIFKVNALIMIEKYISADESGVMPVGSPFLRSSPPDLAQNLFRFQQCHRCSLLFGHYCIDGSFSGTASFSSY